MEHPVCQFTRGTFPFIFFSLRFTFIAEMALLVYRTWQPRSKKSAIIYCISFFQLFPSNSRKQDLFSFFRSQRTVHATGKLLEKHIIWKQRTSFARPLKFTTFFAVLRQGKWGERNVALTGTSIRRYWKKTDDQLKPPSKNEIFTGVPLVFTTLSRGSVSRRSSTVQTHDESEHPRVIDQPSILTTT